jgi:predicted polyphosphate/ATP-dependent NAD kinase
MPETPCGFQAHGETSSVSPRTLGLIVNPIAGLGGSVGLKGTDGTGTAERALELGATPRAGARAALALSRLAAELPNLQVLTGPGDLGETQARAAGFHPEVIGEPSERTTAADTRRLSTEMGARGVDLLLFAGGDGTARDICAAIGTSIPVLGIPSGVKMHSAVFATTPGAAGQAALKHLTAATPRVREAEVMDIDEQAFRNGAVSARLYGMLLTPATRGLLQSLKSGRGSGDAAELAAIAADVVQHLRHDELTILGPGTTTRAVLDHLGLEGTLLGVDVLYRGELLRRDATERDLLGYLAETPGRIIVTPIGGQGYIFGRGNQQLSPPVLRQVGLPNITVIATPSKVASLDGHALRVDTGDEELDAALRGYRRVITGYGVESVLPVQ